MVRTARERNLCLAVDLNHRFTPAARTAKQWQLDGRIGELLFINMNLWIGKFGDFETEFYHLKALNPHSVDIVRYFGGDIDEVQCFAMKASGRNLYSTQSMNLRFANGAVGHITSSYDIKRGHPMERCEVAGTNGRLLFEDMWREATLFPADDLVKLVYTNPSSRLHRFLRHLADRSLHMSTNCGRRETGRDHGTARCLEASGIHGHRVDQARRAAVARRRDHR